jgi:putative RNA 2'-phosphotransferase
MNQTLKQRSKRLSWLLRHGAIETGLSMDPAGWAAVGDVQEAVKLSREELEEVVATNTKRRLQLEGDRIRACQGHSPGGVPVTLEALEASWRPWNNSSVLWHGTSRSALSGIARGGLQPQRRTHVHLSSSRKSTVGKRAAVDVMLSVDPAVVRSSGVHIFEAPNGVILTRAVPREAIVELVPMTRRSRAREAELRQQLGLTPERLGSLSVS